MVIFFFNLQKGLFWVRAGVYGAEESRFLFYLDHGWIWKQLEEKTQACWVLHMFISVSNAPQQCTAPFQCSKKKKKSQAF